MKNEYFIEYEIIEALIIINIILIKKNKFLIVINIKKFFNSLY